MDRVAAALLGGCMLLLAGCQQHGFLDYPPNYHEFAYISDGGSNTVTVLDLVYLRQDRVLQVGRDPTGLAVNPVRNEVYAVNTGSNSVTVIDATNNTVAATIGVRQRPYFIAVSPDGHRAYVPDAGSNTVSVIDLDARRQIAVAATGESPGMAAVAPDNRTLVVTNEQAGSVSVYSINESKTAPLTLRDAFAGCPGATDAVILPDSTKAFIACSGGRQVMDIWLAAAPNSWRGKQDPSLQHDQLLALLDVGQTPTHLAMEPNGYEVFSTNFGSDSISEISTWTNEVLGTYLIGSKPARAIISQDDSTLWATNFGADSASLYSIDDGRVEAGIRTGPKPDALAFSTDERLLLVADTGSSDVAVIRTQSKNGPALVTMLPAGDRPNDLVVKSFRSRSALLH
ncbi:MAG TPA: YncE family protein [Candidatus Aquilonibacter sp.]|nr:YncE family protein [Candidatus Aquilonibacter sp.]